MARKKRHNISTREGRIKAAQEAHDLAMEIARDETQPPRERVTALVSARQDRADMRKEDEYVPQVEREVVAELRQKQAELEEKIAGARPRRLAEPPREPGSTETRH